ncbi:hypothetical protein SEPCBS57363_001724 [Sporothrix epigloea]|uniref:Zn(2)-C6 fungal-type domain-containing protein n=1 Tax=Sporothrix epigloea TaxID=1892477 RepID=A0ABP0DBX5_9PEZI
MQPTGFRACEACRALKVRCIPADYELAVSGGSEGFCILDGTAGSGNIPAVTVLPPVSQRNPCRRCQSTGTTCIYTEPRRTKRKRTDVRVRELEREVRMLTELLVVRRRTTEESISAAEYEVTEATHSTARAVLTATEEVLSDQTIRSVQQSLPGTPSALFDTSPTSTSLLEPAQAMADPVAAGLLSMDKATRLFRRYVTTIAPQRPFVVFPKVTLSEGEDLTPEIEGAITDLAALVREHHPVLFLSVLTAAVSSGLDRSYGDTDSSNEVLSTAFDTLLLRVYADRIFHQSEKSLELVQALIISSNWSFYGFDKPRSNPAVVPSSSIDHNHYQREKPAASTVSSFDHLRCYQHMHMATTMAIELESLHLDSTSSQDSCVSRPVTVGLLADPLAFERTLLACYICCSSISLGFHRQTMLSFTPVMSEYLRRLEISPYAAATDRIIVTWVHLQRTVDSTADTLHLRAVIRESSGALATLAGTTSKELPDLSDPSVQRTLQDVTQRLEQWRLDHNRYMTNSLLIQYNTIMCLLHESCFYNEFDPADLKPPYRLSIPSTTARDALACRPMTPAHVASRRICLMAARSLIGLFLASPTEQLLGSPVVVYARVGYAVLVLLKLQISAALPGGAMRGILIDSATGDSATQIYQYLESLIARLEELKTLGGRIAAIWMTMVRITHAWYEAYFLPAANGCPPQTADNSEFGAVLEPLRHCFLSKDECDMRKETTEVRQKPTVGTDMYPRAALVSGVGTTMCGTLTTMSNVAAEAFSPGASLDTDEIDQWMDPRIGLGDIQNRIFELFAM